VTTIPGPGVRWRKSSRSDGTNTCVELAHTLTAVRDSKNPEGGALTLPADGVRALVRVAQQGA
jgi:hypothetical protein